MCSVLCSVIGLIQSHDRAQDILEVQKQFSAWSQVQAIFSSGLEPLTFWVLVDEYTITDAEGNPYSDPNYVVAPLRFRDQGRITALLATDFTF